MLSIEAAFLRSDDGGEMSIGIYPKGGELSAGIIRQQSRPAVNRVGRPGHSLRIVGRRRAQEAEGQERFSVEIGLDIRAIDFSAEQVPVSRRACNRGLIG